MSLPIFTHRHYEFVARVLHASKPSEPMRLDMWTELCVRLAESFAADSPRFDYTRFYEITSGENLK